MTTSEHTAPPVPQLPARQQLDEAISALTGRLVRAAELRTRPEPEWLLGATIPATGVGQIYGPAYCGKTYLTLDLALSVANGKAAWFGRALGVPRPVVYVLMEGSFDFGKRITAWLAAHGGTDEDLWVLDEQAVNLADPESVAQLQHDITCAGIAPGLVVIDTQALATAGTEENSNRDMGVVIANLKRFARAVGTFVLLVHHTGHSDTHARGASAQRAAWDVELSVRDRVLSADKVKAGQPWESPEPFRITAAGGSAVVVGETSVYELVRAKGGRTAAQLASLLGKRKADVLAELDGYVSANLMRVETATGRGKAKTYWAGSGDD